MGKSEELLRSDLRAMHNALGEILKSVQLAVPSWQFPERLANVVALDDVLGSQGDDNQVSVLLLEGIVDR